MGRKPIYAAFLLAALLAGCGSPISSAKNEGVPFDANNPSGSDPGSGSGVNNSSGFFVKVTSDTAQSLHLHRSSAAYGAAAHPTTGFDQECRITTDSALYTNIVCIAEIEELDLYFGELKVQYHVPRNMCRYLRFNPYHFWANQPGYGVTNVSWDALANGTFDNNVNAAGGKPNPCIYNYEPQGGPNCCLGTYTKSVRVQNAGGGFDPPVVTQESWGGKPGNCLFGPAVDTQPKTTANIPKPDIFYVETNGLNQTYTIKPAINMSFGEIPVQQNIWAASYYDRADHGGDKPIPMRSVYTVPASPPVPASPGYQPSDTYDFSCLDPAEEVRYRIRLMIREWNQNPVADGGDPEIGGTWPGLPDPGDPDAYINDRMDWKDVVTYPRDLFL